MNNCEYCGKPLDTEYALSHTMKPEFCSVDCRISWNFNEVNDFIKATNKNTSFY
jgi:hypothetical protein